MTLARPFHGFRIPPEVILWAVRWYLRFALSFRDLEEMLAKRPVRRVRADDAPAQRAFVHRLFGIAA